MNFENKDVYELIDGILTDAIKNIEDYNGASEYQCIHCCASVNEFKFASFEDAEKAIVHDSKCPYTLAISMNVGRDFKKFPLNV